MQYSGHTERIAGTVEVSQPEAHVPRDVRHAVAERLNQIGHEERHPAAHESAADHRHCLQRARLAVPRGARRIAERRLVRRQLRPREQRDVVAALDDQRVAAAARRPQRVHVVQVVRALRDGRRQTLRRAARRNGGRGGAAGAGVLRRRLAQRSRHAAVRVLRAHAAAAQLAHDSGAARRRVLVRPLRARVQRTIYAAVFAVVVFVVAAVVAVDVVAIVEKNVIGGGAEQRLRLAGRIFANGWKGAVHLAVCVD